MKSGSSPASERKVVGVREGFFTQPLWPLEQVRLRGCRCCSCEEVFLGSRPACENCQSEELEDLVLSNRGKLYSYTVIRHRPPGEYKGPEPFVPFAIGLVELPEGVRILSPLTGCELEALQIDMDLELVVEKHYQDEDGNDVITYRFRPC